MNPTKRIAAAFMAVLFCASAVVTSGCGKSKVKSTNDKISETDEWYSIQKLRIGEEYTKDKDIDYIYADYVGLYEGKPVYSISGQYVQPEDAYLMEDFDYDSLSIERADIYGLDGQLEKSIDIHGLIKAADLFKVDPNDYNDVKDEFLAQIHSDDSGDGDSGDDTETVSTGNGTNMSDEELFERIYLTPYWYLQSDYDIVGDKLCVNVYVYMQATSMTSFGEEKYYKVEIDINTEEIVSCTETPDSGNGYVISNYNFDGYRVRIISVHDYMTDESSFTIEVTDPDGDFQTYDLSKLIKDVEIDYVTGMMYLGDGKAIACVQTASYDKKAYECDLKTGTFKEYQKDITNFLSDFFMTTYISGVGNVIVEEDGIKKVDIDTGTKTCIFSFDSCNINRFETMMMSLLTMTDDKIYLGSYGTYSVADYDVSSSIPTLYILSKEDKNPNAGKTVLRATVTNYITSAVSEAVCIFNETSPDYYIKLTDEYSLQSKARSGEYSWSDDNAEEKAAQIQRDLAYQLLSDLKNGDGPDLIFGYGVESQFNNSEYLLDLKSEIGTEGLFDNIVKASETNGKIYQYPLAFVIEGILVDKDDVAEDQCGFTYDQYKDFVSGVCNGEDPINYDQIDYFNIGFRRFVDKCIGGKKVNFNNDEIKTLAEYVSENVIKRPQDETYDYFEPVEYGSWTASFESNITIYQLMNQYADSLEHLKIMGAPSIDGSGPSLSVTSCVGVSAHTGEKEACINFVKGLLNDDVQQAFAEKAGETPVCKAAFEATAKRAVVNYNFVFEKYSKSYGSYLDIKDSGMPWHRVNPSFVEDYESIIDSCSGLVMSEPGIALIIDEELPAYFTGQKSLDEVIKIIENRAQTMLDERG